METAEQVEKCVYVDDGVCGGDEDLVEFMMGPEGIRNVLGRVGLKVKFLIKSGDADPEKIAALGKAVLGVGYNLVKDEINMEVTLKYTKMEGRSKVECILSPADIRGLRRGENKWTRRMALSLVMGIFDPLGLIVPMVLQGKLLLRRLATLGIAAWDEDLPVGEKKEMGKMVGTTGWGTYLDLS